MSLFPTEEVGIYHLTPTGWIRKDAIPFPDDRLESWSYQAECSADDAKEEVCLRRFWIAAHTAEQERDALRNRFGMPVSPQVSRNVTLECEV